jgi:hypothetical protein
MPIRRLITSDFRPIPEVVALENSVVSCRQSGIQPIEQSELLPGESIKNVQVC